MRISQVIIVCFGCFMGVMAIILLEINISLGCAPAVRRPASVAVYRTVSLFGPAESERMPNTVMSLSLILRLSGIGMPVLLFVAGRC